MLKILTIFVSVEDFDHRLIIKSVICLKLIQIMPKILTNKPFIFRYYLKNLIQ